MTGIGADARVRMAAFEWLAEQLRVHGDVLPRTVLARGFQIDGQRVPLVGPQGIFKPKLIPEIPLSIATVASGPYDDGFGPDGLLRYRYRGSDPQHHENVGLRRAMETRTPLIYFHGVMKSHYVAAWPAYIVGDDPSRLTFKVAVDDARYASASLEAACPSPADSDPPDAARREYITATFRRRLHQTAFRERVLRAYRRQCALCRLRHEQLLDAAHIVPDAEPQGEPLVTNGIALCKLHHAAFDQFFLTVRPDYLIVIRPDILEEADGPMLQHGLKGLHNLPILLPRDPAHRPDRDRLQWHLERFRALG